MKKNKKYTEEGEVYKKIFRKKTSFKRQSDNKMVHLDPRVAAMIDDRKLKKKDKVTSNLQSLTGHIEAFVIWSPESLVKARLIKLYENNKPRSPDEVRQDIFKAVQMLNPEENEVMITVIPAYRPLTEEEKKKQKKQKNIKFKGLKVRKLTSKELQQVGHRLASAIFGHEGLYPVPVKKLIVDVDMSVDEALTKVKTNYTKALKKEIIKTAATNVRDLSPDEILKLAAAVDKEYTAELLKKHGLDKTEFAKFIKSKIRQKGSELFSLHKPESKPGKPITSQQKQKMFFTKLMTIIAKNTSEKLDKYIKASSKIERLSRADIEKADIEAKQALLQAEKDIIVRNLKELKKKKSIRKFLEILKNTDPKLNNELVLYKYLQTPEGRKHAADILEGLVKNNAKEWSEGALKTIERNLGIPAPYEILNKIKESNIVEYKIRGKAEINARKAVATVLYGQPGNYRQLLTTKLYNLLAQDPEFKEIAVKATKEGSTEKIEEYVKNKLSGMTISYGELQALLNTPKIRKDVLDKLKNAGVNITDIPEVEDTVSKIKTEERIGTVSTIAERLKGKITARGTAIRAPTKKGGLIFGSTAVQFRKGGKTPTIEEYVGALSPTGLKTRLIKYISTLPEREKRKIEKRLKKYRELGFDQVLTDDELVILAVTKDPIYKLRKLLKVRKMLEDETYYQKEMTKKLKRKTEVELQALKIAREYQKRKKALSSPFWSAWFKLSTRTKVILTFVIAASILFMPVGLFYVGGWALAVGITALISFIIWIFMESWFLIAQGIVGLINFVGQTIINAINAAGRAISSYLGYSFSPMSFQLIQNMRINLGEGKGFPWGAWNLVPPSFLRLEHFMPITFDTDPIIAKIYPPLANLFRIIYGPIAERYTAWIKTAEWYYVGAIIGIPLLIIIVLIVLAVRWAAKKWKEVP